MTDIVYKIKLTPLDRFFFGGENVFGSDGGQDDRRRSYLVNSNLLPQQTTLLGMLRYQLLAQNNLLLTPNSDAAAKEQAAQLVGANSFMPDRPDVAFGIIKGLSPLTIEDFDGNAWQPLPLDDCQFDTDHQSVALEFDFDEEANTPYLKNYKPKQGLELQFGTQEKARKTLDEFFKPASQVGITMTNRLGDHDRSEEERAEAYYFQTFRTNGQSTFASAQRNTAPESFSFVFYVKIQGDSQEFRFSDGLATLGGDGSVFNMKVAKVSTPDALDKFQFPIQYQFNTLSETFKSRFKRVVLVNDAYADWDLLQAHCTFIVAELVPFRCFTTNLRQVTDFAGFRQGNGSVTRQQSALFTLLQRGAVLYVEGEENLAAVTRHLEDQTAFKTIGYNYFQIL